MLLYVHSEFEIINLFHFLCLRLSLYNVSHFEIVVSMYWLIAVLQTAQYKSKFMFKRGYKMGISH